MRSLFSFFFCLFFFFAHGQRSVKKKLEGSWQVKTSVNYGVGESYGDSGDIYTFFPNRDYQRETWLHPKNGGKDTLLIRKGSFDFYIDSDEPEHPLIELLFFDEEDLCTGDDDAGEYEYHVIFIGDSTMLFTDRVEGVNDTMWLRRIPAKERVYKMAHSVAPKTLYGSWQIQQSAFPSEQGMLQPGSALTLTADQRYQLVTFISRYDTLAEHSRLDTVVETGLWALSGTGNLTLYNRSIVDKAMKSASYEPALQFYIASVQDVKLVVYTQEKGLPVQLPMNRIPQMPWFAIVQPLYFDTDDRVSGSHYYHDVRLVNSMDTTKTKLLKREFYLEADCPADSARGACTAYYRGDMIAASDSVVRFSAQRDSYRRPGAVEGSRYENHWHYGSPLLLDIPVRSIHHIGYQSAASENIEGAFGLIGVYSFLGATIVAPLVSINYRNWTFNRQRFFTLAGIGLAGVVISVPMVMIFQPREFLITSHHGFKSKKYWYVEEF